VRADRIIVRETDAAHSQGTNVVDARVVGIRATSAGWLVELDAGGLVAFVPRAYAGDRVSSVGAPVTLEIPVEAVHLIPERS
jgi:hypothetical protein